MRRCAHVSIDGERIDSDLLHRIRPKPGRTVTITTVPRFGGGSKSPLRFLLMLVVAAASFAVPALLELNSIILFGGLTLGQVAGAAIFGIGSLLVNAFIPAQTPKMKELNGTSGRDSPSLAIQGIRNQANPYGVVPRLYGKMRVTPYFGAKTFTEIRGKDTYLRVLFDFGYGPLKLSGFRIGQTDLDSYEDVLYEVREGWPDDPPLTLYTRIPNEEGFNIRLLQNEWQQRTTEPDSDEISLDFTFPQGLASFDSDGDKLPQTVEFDIEFRTKDTGGGPGPWQSATKPVAFGARLTGTLARPQPTSGIGFKNSENKINHTTRIYRVSLDHVTGKMAVVSGSGNVANPSKNKPICRVAVSSNTDVPYQLTNERSAEDIAAGYFVPSLVGQKVQIGAGTLTPPDFIVTDNSTAIVRRNKAFKVDRGQYDVQVKRITADSNATNVFHQSFWTALRTFTNEPPIAAKGRATVAMEIRATDQLNGIVDQFNCIAESILWDYDAQLGDWIERPTSNPAAAYRDILMGSANKRPVAGERMYWPEIETWSEDCRAEDREFNAYLDFRQSVFEALRLVAGSARADFAMRDGKYSVVRDRVQTVPVQHITPRNSWGFRWRREFPDMPHAFRIAFKNREKDWLLDERIVPFDGWTEETASKFTDLEFIGITDPAQIFLEARYRQADAKLRATTYWCNMDFEHLVARHGSLVLVTHDTILVGIKAGRVKTLTLDVGNNVLGFVSDELLPMEPGKTYGVSIRTAINCKVVRPLVLSIGENSAVTFATPIGAEEAAAIGLVDADIHRDRPLFGFGETGLETLECLVKRVVAGPDLTARLELKPYAPAVLDADADPIPPFESKITLPSQFDFRAPEKPIVEDVKSDETMLAVQPDGSLESRIHVILARKATLLPPAVTIKVRYQRTDAPTGAWQNMPAFPGDATEVWAQPVDDKVAYDVEISAVAADGSPSEWTRIENHTVIGQSTPPPDITTLLVETTSDGRRRIRWTYPNQPRDHRGFVPRRLPGISFEFDQAQDLSDDPIPGTFVDLPVLDGTWTILVKARDRSGNFSVNAATAIINLPEAEDLNILFERDYAAENFDLGGDGTVTNGSLVSGELVADATGDAFWTGDANPFWTNDNALFWTTTYEAMTFVARLVPDVGHLPARLRLKLEVDAAAWTIAYRPTGSQAPAWDPDDSVQVWTGDSDPAWDPDPDFVPWPGELADLLHQQYEFRVNTSSGVKQGVISGFIAVLDTEDVTELLSNIAIAAGGTRLPITAGRFRQIFHIQPTVLSGGNAVNIVPIDYDHVLGPLVKGIDGAAPPNFVAATASVRVHGI